MIYAIAGTIVAVLLLVVFLRADAARIATSLRLIGPIILGVVGAGLLLIGRAGLGGMALSSALAWYGAGRMRQRSTPTPGKRSHVRTAALEMELDHDTGGLDGVVLTGRFDGTHLADMGE